LTEFLLRKAGLHLNVAPICSGLNTGEMPAAPSSFSSLAWQPDHSASLGDSITSSTGIRFSVHTDGVHVGTVDKVEVNRIKLTKKDSGEG
jgi:hypothetical protein